MTKTSRGPRFPLDPHHELVSHVPWRAVIVYLLISFGLAWVVILPLWINGQGLNSSIAGVLLSIMMFTPGIAALIVVFFVQKPRPNDVSRYLGVWPLRPLGRTLWMCVAAIFGSAAIVVAGVFLAAAFGLVQLDLVHFSSFSKTMADAGADFSKAPIGLFVIVQLVVIPFGAVFNGIFTIGEELGWRGWLLPSLRPLGTWPALLITGAIWGLWHAPVILLGYNFNEPNILGLLMMVGGCTVFGILVGWLRLRTASIWPSVFAHGAFNAAAGFIGIVMAEGSQPSALALSPLGWVTWIVMGVAIAILALFGQFSRGRLSPQ